MRTIILILTAVAIIAMPISAQNITRTDDNGNTLYFGPKLNKENKNEKAKPPTTYEVIAPLTPAVGKSERSQDIDTIWVPFVNETIQKYNGEINGTVTVPKRITHNDVNYPISGVGTQAFKDCKKLKKVLLPMSVTEIGHEAFCGCTELTTIILPPDLKKIGNFAFDHCKKLKTIELHSQTPPVMGEHSDFYLNGVTLIVPQKTADIYRTKEPWSNAKAIIESSDDNSSANVFWTTAETGQKFICKINNQEEKYASIISFSILTPYIKCDESYDDVAGEMKLPFSVTNEGSQYNINTLEQNAFNSCDITNVRIPSSITIIEKGAFKDCKKLTYVRIDGGHVEIADDAFDGIPEDAVLSVPKLCGSYYKQLPACKKFKEIKEAMAK